MPPSTSTTARLPSLAAEVLVARASAAVANRLAQHHVTLDRRVSASNADRSTQAQTERVTQIGAGGFADQNAADRRDALEPSGHVDGIAHDGEGALATRADRTRQYHAGVDADTHLHLEADLLAEASIQQSESRLHLQSRQNGAARIIVVGDRRAERGHHRVAQEFVDFATVVADGLVEHLEAAVDGGDELFGRQDLGEARKAANVGKQNGDGSEVAFDLGEPFRVPRSALGAERWCL
jgi:hypothetical protein